CTLLYLVVILGYECDRRRIIRNRERVQVGADQQIECCARRKLLRLPVFFVPVVPHKITARREIHCALDGFDTKISHWSSFPVPVPQLVTEFAGRFGWWGVDLGH